jgi:post-segregation antitoxin (ccd killing protein)
MARIRVSTTVDEDLLAEARAARHGVNDAALIDEALGALLARNRRAEIDASYAAYDEDPIDSTDEWGDLATWRRSAGTS